MLARRPYGSWIGTALLEEQAARRTGLDGARRIAQAINAPALHRLERATLRGAAVNWATSPASRAGLAKAAGIPESSIQIVPIPIDCKLFTPLPVAEWEAGLAAPSLIFVGRADDPRKNIGLLLEAFERIHARLPGANLKLVGTAPADRLPPGVEVMGRVPSLAATLRATTLFILPSLQEGFGIVVGEALASGVPVIVTPCGGPEDLVRSSGGGEVLAGFTPDELSERALALLGDRARLLEMRRRGRAYVERVHDPARLQDALAEALEKLARAG